MAKDPAFLFYSSDWLSGTAEMLPEEKGVYIDLLAYQHLKGSLPIDTRRLARLVRMSEPEFMVIWDNVKQHFNQMDNQLVNERLTKVMTERKTYSQKLMITGIFASLIKKHNNKFQIETIKKAFNVQDFMYVEKELVKEMVNQWYNQMVIQMDNNLEDEDVIENEDKSILGLPPEKQLKKPVRKKEPLNTEIILPFQSEEFKAKWFIWKSYKKKEHQFSYKSPESEKASLTELYNLSTGDEQTAIKIIDQSLAKGWKGFFKLKTNIEKNVKSNNNNWAESVISMGQSIIDQERDTTPY